MSAQHMPPVTKAQGRQFLSILNDRISNGDLVLPFLSVQQAGETPRKPMDDYLKKLMTAAIGKTGGAA